MDIFLDCGYLAGQANVLNYLGVVRRLTGNFAGAVAALEAALGVCRELGTRGAEANALTELGAVYPLAGTTRALPRSLHAPWRYAGIVVTEARRPLLSASSG